MIKVLFLLAFSFPVLFVGEKKDQKADVQLQFARAVFNHILAKDEAFASEKYLDQKSFEAMIAQMEKKPSQVVLDREVQKYDEKKLRFVKAFNESFSAPSLGMSGCGDIDWGKAKIDSMQYDYMILKPEEQDVEIIWPESLQYIPAKNDYVCNRSRVYFSDGAHAYAMQFQSVGYNKTWWFFHKLRTPTFQKMK